MFADSEPVKWRDALTYRRQRRLWRSWCPGSLPEPVQRAERGAHKCVEQVSTCKKKAEGLGQWRLLSLSSSCSHLCRQAIAVEQAFKLIPIAHKFVITILILKKHLRACHALLLCWVHSRPCNASRRRCCIRYILCNLSVALTAVSTVCRRTEARLPSVRMAI